MKLPLSKATKNALIVAGITTLSGLVNRPIPDVGTIYQAGISAALAIVVSLERTSNRNPATGILPNSAEILHLLPWLKRTRKGR